VVITARNEAARISSTIDALRLAFPGSIVVLGDDCSDDATAALARGRGVEVVGDRRRRGKGATASRAAARALELGGSAAVYVLCDGDLGASAAQLSALIGPLDSAAADIVVAAFTRRTGGGFGIAVGFARWALRHRCGVTFSAPLSGQRALNAKTLAAALPFARGYGMELAMTLEVLRAGGTVVELPLDLEHRAHGRDVEGFAHRARQLLDLVAAYASRRR